MDVLQEIKNTAERLGVSDIGFCRVDDGVGGLKNAVLPLTKDPIPPCANRGKIILPK